MAELISCPRCSAELSLPSEEPADHLLQCPQCAATFEPADAERRQIAQAVFAERPAPPAEEEPTPPIAGLRETIELSTPGVIEGTISESAASDTSSTLSDWLNRETPAVEETAPAVSESPADPTAPLPTEESPETSEPVAAENAQPSLESLLSSFRGEPSPQESPEPSPTEALREESSNLFSSKATLSGIETVADLAPLPTPKPEEPSTPEAAVEETTTPTAESAEPSEEREPVSEPTTSDFGFDFDMPGATAAEEEPTESPSVSSLDDSSSHDQLSKRSRKRRWVQPAAVSVCGLVGVSLGYLGLLWVGGPSSDLLGASRGMPSFMLPASFDQNDPAAPAIQPRSTPPADPSSVPPPSEVDLVTFEQSTPEASDPNPLVSEGSPREPAPLPMAHPPAEARLLNAPESFTAAQLRELLTGAEQARRAMSEKSLANTPDAARELGGAYAQLCQIAQALTFLEMSPTDRDLTNLEAKELFHRLFAHRHAREDASNMASRWLAFEQRPHGGVFFAGELVSAQRKGSVVEFRVRLSSGQGVTVLSAHPLRPNRFIGAKALGVVGSVVESATSQVVGYEGDKDQVIWAAHTISLGEPQFD